MTEEIKPDTPETPTEPPKMARYREFLTQKYPDRTFESEQEAEDAFYEDYSQDTQSLKGYREDNEKIFELMSDNPELGQIMSELSKGTPFIVAVAKSIDLQDLIPEKGEPNYEAYTKAASERKARRAELDSQSKEFIANQEQTQADAIEFFEKNNIPDEECKGLVLFMDGIIADMARGKISKEVLRKLYEAYRYEEDVATAADAGRVEGRNQKIEEKRIKNGNTDGLPQGKGASIAPTQETPAARKIIDFNSIRNQ